MKRLSYNGDTLYKKYGAEKAARFIKDAGFDAVDFSFTALNDDNHPFLYDDYLETAHKLREVYNDAMITVNQAHAPYSFPLEEYLKDDVLENKIIPRIVRSMEMASVLGAETIIVHPIHYRWITPDEAFDRNMRYYGKLVSYCEKFGIRIAVENMWDRDLKRGYIIHDTCSTKEEFVKYIDALSSPYIVACLDTGHVGLPCGQRDEAHDFVRALGRNRLKALHIHDNNLLADEHSLPFSGKVNWFEFAKALGEINYDGDFTYEVDGKTVATVPEELVPSVLKHWCDVLKYIKSVADSYRK